MCGHWSKEAQKKHDKVLLWKGRRASLRKTMLIGKEASSKNRPRNDRKSVFTEKAVFQQRIKSTSQSNLRHKQQSRSSLTSAIPLSPPVRSEVLHEGSVFRRLHGPRISVERRQTMWRRLGQHHMWTSWVGRLKIYPTKLQYMRTNTSDTWNGGRSPGPERCRYVPNEGRFFGGYDKCSLSVLFVEWSRHCLAHVAILESFSRICLPLQLY